MAQVLDRHISIDPAFSHGRPRIEGHRIRVQDIAIWHERLGLSVDEIAADYDLSLAKIYAAFAYYFDHKAQIDSDIEADEAFVEAFKRDNPSLLRQRLEELRAN